MEMETKEPGGLYEGQKPEKPKAPDGGWGWVVVFASFMIHVIADGVSYSFGLFFIEITKEFQGTRSAASWIGSILLGVTFGVGPLASLFVNRYGCRAGTVTGAIIAAFGFAISYLATGILYLYFSIGLIGGLGLGLMYLPAIVCVSIYFEKKRSLATGIAVCGSGFGTFALAPIYDWLISHIGWRLSMVAVAFTLLICIGFGLLFKPLEPDSSGTDNPNYEPGVYVLRNDNVNSSTDKKELEPGVMEMTAVKPPKAKAGVKKMDSLEEIALKTDTLPHIKGDCRDRDEIFLSESLGTRNKEASRPGSSFSIIGCDTVKLHSSAGRPSSLCRKLCQKLHSWKGAALMTTPVFLFIAVSNFLTNVGYNVPYIYLADLAKESLKLQDNDRSLGWLVSSIGISNTISRVVLGYISDQKWANRLYIYSTSLTLCGISIAFSPLGNSLFWLFVCASVFGGSGGVYVGLTSVILVDLLGLDKLSDAFGIVLLFQGVGTLVGPPVVGALFDSFQDYVYGFWFAGITIAISGSMLFLIPVIQRCQDSSPLTRRSRAPSTTDQKNPYTIA